VILLRELARNNRKPLEKRSIRLNSEGLLKHNAARFANGTEIVSHEIGDHRKLCTLFFRAIQRLSILFLLLRSLAKRPCSLHGTRLNDSIIVADEEFRRDGGQSKLGMVDKKAKRPLCCCIQRIQNTPWVGLALEQILIG